MKPFIVCTVFLWTFVYVRLIPDPIIDQKVCSGTKKFRNIFQWRSFKVWWNVWWVGLFRDSLNSTVLLNRRRRKKKTCLYYNILQVFLIRLCLFRDSLNSTFLLNRRRRKKRRHVYITISFRFSLFDCACSVIIWTLLFYWTEEGKKEKTCLYYNILQVFLIRLCFFRDSLNSTVLLNRRIRKKRRHVYIIISFRFSLFDCAFSVIVWILLFYWTEEEENRRHVYITISSMFFLFDVI